MGPITSWRRAGMVAGGLACLGLAACGSTTTAAPAAHTSSAAPVAAAVLADLAPTGRVRFAMLANPPLFASKDAAGAGVGVELENALAQKLGEPVTTVGYGDPGAAIAAASSGAWDVAILPIIPPAQAVADLTAPFLLVPHTFLVRADSPIHAVADADRAGVRIASVAGEGHTAVLAQQLKQARLVPVPSPAAALQMLASGQVDAVADARFALRAMAAQVAGSRLVADDFFVARFALAVPKGHATAQAFLSRFVEAEKASGRVQQAIDRLGKPDIMVAPATTT
jgi:polar amino acid transport system substrate-binding protein